MKSHYQIAGISILVDAPTELIDNEGFSLYRVPNTCEPLQRQYQIFMIPEPDFSIPTFDGEPVFRDIMHLVLQKDEKVLHLFHIPGTKGISAWNWITDENKVEIHYHPSCSAYYLDSVGCFNTAGFERIIFQFGMHLFHCSYVDDNGGAVLFSAPSGGGKTTQALQWEKYAGAEIINGDRAVLEAGENGYIAHGLPIAGSSGVFLNRTLPIRAIFIVTKADRNNVTPLSHQDAFKGVFSELTINTWNHLFVLSAVDFAMNLAATVPVYHLECTISEEAVQMAKNTIL